MITPTTTTADLTEDQIRADALRWAANRIDPGPAATRRQPFDLLDEHVMIADRGAATELRFWADQVERGAIAATVLPIEQRTGTLPVDAPAGAVRPGMTVSINHPTQGHVTGQVISTTYQGTILLDIAFYSPALGHQNRINDAILVEAEHIARS